MQQHYIVSVTPIEMINTYKNVYTSLNRSISHSHTTVSRGMVYGYDLFSYFCCTLSDDTGSSSIVYTVCLEDQFFWSIQFNNPIGPCVIVICTSK